MISHSLSVLDAKTAIQSTVPVLGIFFERFHFYKEFKLVYNQQRSLIVIPKR